MAPAAGKSGRSWRRWWIAGAAALLGAAALVAVPLLVARSGDAADIWVRKSADGRLALADPRREPDGAPEKDLECLTMTVWYPPIAYYRKPTLLERARCWLRGEAAKTTMCIYGEAGDSAVRDGAVWVRLRTDLSRWDRGVPRR